VSSYEIGDYVYFFFRETAVEFINCGKVCLVVGLSFYLFVYIRFFVCFSVRLFNCNLQGAAKSGPLKFFVVFAATVWDFNMKFYSFFIEIFYI